MEHFYYAQLNENGKVIGKSSLSGEVNQPYMIRITAEQYVQNLLDYTHDLTTNQFIAPPPPTEAETLTIELQEINQALRQQYEDDKFNTWLNAQRQVASDGEISKLMSFPTDILPHNTPSATHNLTTQRLIQRYDEIKAILSESR
jgi:hypothetical protein